MAKYHDVTVLCGDVSGELLTKKDLAKYFSEISAIEKLTINYVEPSRFIQWIERIHRIPGLWCFYYLAYNLWQRKAFKIAKQLHAKNSFDLVHQLNMIGYREPGYLWKLGIPFVWGPVGGASNESWAFRSLFSWSGSIKVFLRTMLNEFQKRISFRSKKAARSTIKLWAVTDADMKMIGKIWGVNVEQMIETGTITREASCPRTWCGDSPLRIVWSGIHTSRKALPILLYAICAPDVRLRVHVDILGIGHETRVWKNLADKLGLSGCLTWHGQLPHQRALEIMKSAHVLAFPSLKEGTPHVVLEALSMGLPVVCHDACGMGVVVDESCGAKIRLKECETSIAGMQAVIRQILATPSWIVVRSQGALRRAQELSWDNKVETIALAYERIINDINDRDSSSSCHEYKTGDLYE
jgi:glycosyltransferase involved in cell wall biosynthesis